MPRRAARPNFEKQLAQLLRNNVKQGIMTRSQARDTMKQYRFFKNRRRSLRAKYAGKAVGVAGGLPYVANTLGEIVAQVHAVNPTLMIYAEEPIRWTL